MSVTAANKAAMHSKAMFVCLYKDDFVILLIYIYIYILHDNALREIWNDMQQLRVHFGGICDNGTNALADIPRPIIWWQCMDLSITLYVTWLGPNGCRSDGCPPNIQMTSKHAEAAAIWLTTVKRHFQKHFLQWEIRQI